MKNHILHIMYIHSNLPIYIYIWVAAETGDNMKNTILQIGLSGRWVGWDSPVWQQGSTIAL